MSKRGLVWIRRDIRLHDHAALSKSIAENDETVLVFVFDPVILDPIIQKTREDSRLQFIAESLFELSQTLEKQAAGIEIVYGEPHIKLAEIVQKYDIDTVYFNRDYSPNPIKRDAQVTNTLDALGVTVRSYKDHVIVEPEGVLNQQDLPYKVFTPYSKAWKEVVLQNGFDKETHDVEIQKLKNNCQARFDSVASILKIAGFKQTTCFLKGGTAAAKEHLAVFENNIATYDKTRDFPDMDKTSKLSVYIRHGCVSIRELLQFAQHSNSSGADVWINELIWREFYQMVIYHFPHVVTKPFNEKYTDLVYPNDAENLIAWKTGMTGVPIIDAAMRCFNETGWMHNRLRMVVASYLCKILLVDWREGEQYFAEKLLDYDLAANNGGWQWASGTGCDAAPYFRIFNPYTQSQKFDQSGKFIKQHVPELRGLDSKQIHTPVFVKYYPMPIVDYATQRQRALGLYKAV